MSKLMWPLIKPMTLFTQRLFLLDRDTDQSFGNNDEFGDVGIFDVFLDPITGEDLLLDLIITDIGRNGDAVPDLTVYLDRIKDCFTDQG